jgi:hypothetical protein
VFSSPQSIGNGADDFAVPSIGQDDAGHGSPTANGHIVQVPALAIVLKPSTFLVFTAPWCSASIDGKPPPFRIFSEFLMAG